jgi:hypothetical protein
MTLRWTDSPTGGAADGFDAAGFLRATIVRYDAPAGWTVFVSQDRLAGGPWATRAEAEAAAAAAVEAEGPVIRRPRPRGRHREGEDSLGLRQFLG